MSPIQNLHSLLKKNLNFSSWKQALLVSAIGLTAIATFAQALAGSLISTAFFATLCLASYLGYRANEKLEDLKLREKYYETLKASLDTMKAECEAFRSENKIMAQNNKDLEAQVEELKSLLEKLKGSAKLTQELLTSCMSVSQDQKQTEEKVQTLLNKLETQISRQESELATTLHTMAEQIKQFFLHEASGSALLSIKREFIHTHLALESVKTELERIQKELEKTSAELKETSQKIETKIGSLQKEQESLKSLESLSIRVVSLCQNQAIFNQLSLSDRSHAKTLYDYQLRRVQ